MGGPCGLPILFSKEAAGESDEPIDDDIDEYLDDEGDFDEEEYVYDESDDMDYGDEE